ncbi:DNA repair protein [Bradyrhizobium sp. U87765 SZCCT0131]|uniref:ImuA family protein n=1 Tax=unclassified Bradyrhizobium TaxID=2631580 RepID=UPI001BA8D5E0|nr:MULTISPECIES: DNA repair protein [unclassified Bradyrhizobium]MBR1222674.1 DNA repair protein [Bradyrhizobium sp. U87765 SZCCT0131]MBR1265245.1 DNA repair protein [Bradyrhizobium sp. U87765 SZCCT0134]MBR1302976.1 DNA repair protein [Bradyrhizobium sp. U87765 SZCCT0110]MBR1323674.1 DNA repair protein [Bradyrhizobium sp. U87765 SZCCT0109]MBR1346905.1 DNA repair protein [Bradyrhizobium sp. U87765 SZCCT0048]
MSGARTSTLATLRGAIERLEAGETRHAVARVELGHRGADATLQGGVVRSALHEVFAPETRQTASATAFAAGLAWRCAMSRPLLWVRQDFGPGETGALSMGGLAELGLDPRRIVMVQATDIDMGLRVTADALACSALGAVVLDVWGGARQFDSVASRKLTLASQASGVTCLVLRTAAAPVVSTAETRWVVRSARSRRTTAWSAWGAPQLDVALVRHRHGQTGQWIMEWMCDECLFREPSAHSQPAAATPSYRPPAPPAVAHRRAG